MKKSSIRIVCAGALALLASLPALALPVHATFNGTVTGSSGYSQILNEFPIGTAAAFDLTFDDSGLTGSASTMVDFDLAPVSGWMTLGSANFTFDAGHIWSYSYTGDPGLPILSYGMQMTGTGPTFGGGSTLFGLFMRLAADLTPVATDPFMASLRYPTSSGEFYSYAVLSGTHSITRGSTGVPEPASALLLSLGLLLIAGTRKTIARR